MPIRGSSRPRRSGIWIRTGLGLIAENRRLESALVARCLAAVDVLLRYRLVPEDADPERQYGFVDGVEQTCAGVSAMTSRDRCPSSGRRMTLPLTRRGYRGGFDRGQGQAPGRSRMPHFAGACLAHRT